MKEKMATMTKWHEREEMTVDERKLLSANKTLVEKNKFLEMDIKTLISYLKGHKYLEDNVKEIIKYYSINTKKNKSDK